jgi:ketosteroid isomerase-like protein
VSSNADLVRRAFLAINAGDEESFLDLLADDIEWHSATAGLVPASTWRGRDAVRRGRQEVESGGRHVHTTLQELRTNVDDVLVLGVVTSETPHRGRVTLPIAWIWTVRDGKVVRVDSFAGRQRALSVWDRRVAAG